MGGSYSLDYMIGEAEHLRKGYGKEIVAELVSRIAVHYNRNRAALAALKIFFNDGIGAVA